MFADNQTYRFICTIVKTYLLLSSSKIANSFPASVVSGGSTHTFMSLKHLIRITDSFEKTLMLGKIEGGRRGDDRG